MRRAKSTIQRGRHWRVESGFTLLELLVSMTVVSLLATTILFGWRIAAGAWGRANQMVEEQRRMAAIHQVLEMQIAEMTPVTPWLRLGNTSVFFQGEPQMARFLSRYSLLNRSRSGLYRIEYQIAPSSDGSQQLLVNEIPVSTSNELAALLVGAEQTVEGPVLRFPPFERTPQTRVLLKDLTDAHFEYYRPAGPAGPGGWVPEWVGPRTELPRAMAIRVATQPGENRLQPRSIVAGIPSYSRIRR
ncbi:MAG: prepilin-type N-terminal cleavage/methylation domain-containing protein [Acidobacteria bacterium]|nr:prepilin-type N-terminal cleavage/methylation domain-containing protein [Acidobacteriota bacterium]